MAQGPGDRLEIDITAAQEALEIMAKATVIARTLPSHLRDEVAAFTVDGEKKFGFDAWFEDDPKSEFLIPGPRLLALIAGLRRYCKAP